MNNSSKIIVRLGASGCDRSFTLQRKQGANKNIFILPNGQEAYVAEPVLQILAKPFNTCRLEGEHFERLMTVIDGAGSERPMVPVNRVGAGPTEKSAKFKVDVIQKVADGTREGNPKPTTLTFTLAVSQIEDVGEGRLAAPLWLILEKLQQKSSSQWGKKHRQNNSIASEFVPSPLRSTMSPRMTALKEWLAVMRTELLEEERNLKHAQDKKSQEDEKIAADVFSKIPKDATHGTIIKTILETLRGYAFETPRKNQIHGLVWGLIRESRQAERTV